MRPVLSLCYVLMCAFLSTVFNSAPISPTVGPQQAQGYQGQDFDTCC